MASVGAGPMIPAKMPARAGPTMKARLKNASAIPLARPTMSRPTRLGTAAVQAASQTRSILIDQTEPPTIDNLFLSLGTFEFDAGTNGAVVVSNEGTEGFVTIDAVRFVPADREMGLKSQSGQMIATKTPRAAMPDRSYFQLLDELNELRAKAPSPVPMAMAAQDGAISNCRINLGGDPEKPGAEVPRGFATAR